MSPHFFFIHPAKTKNKLYNMCFIKLFLIPSFKTQHRKNLFGRTTSLESENRNDLSREWKNEPKS